MPAIETSVWLALKERIVTLPLSPAIPVVMPKAAAPTGKHIRANWLPNRSQRLFIGSSDPHRRPGILQLSLFSPIGANEAPEVDMQIAGKIAEHFAADLRMHYGDVTVRVTEAPTVAQSFRDENWWHTPISIYVETFG